MCECNESYQYNAENYTCISKNSKSSKKPLWPRAEDDENVDSGIPACGLPCENGRCTFDFMGNPTCTCEEGFSFKSEENTCENSGIPACDLDCSNGRCTFDFMGNPTCTCNEGYTFQSDLKICSLDCGLDCSNGKCGSYDFMGNPSCECDDGFDYNNDDKICVNSGILVCALPCENGRCTFDFMGNPTCTCEEGFFFNSEEKTCDSEIPACDLGRFTTFINV
jgi:hypothetical protein